MSTALTNAGSIADFIVASMPGLPAGVSGNMTTFVDLARQYASQFTGIATSSTNIPENLQSAVVDLAMANTVNMMLSAPGGAEIMLGDLRIWETGQLLTAEQYQKMGEMKLKILGRKSSFARSLS